MEVIIRNLHPDVVEDTLRDVIPTTHHVNVARDKKNNLSREFAFLSFRRAEDGKAAIRHLNGGYFYGRFITAEQAVPHQKSQPLEEQKAAFAFPSFTSEQLSQIKFDDVCCYSVSDEFTSDAVTAIALAFIPLIRQSLKLQKESMRPINVLDACACGGGNTLSFARYFCPQGDTSAASSCVFAIEPNQHRHNLLKLVMELAGVEKRVYAYRSFFEDQLDLFKTDDAPLVVFADPPWGGRDYMTNEGRTKLGSLFMHELIHECRLRCTGVSPTPLFLFKVPNNFDMDHFLSGLCQQFGSLPFVGSIKLPKMHAIIVYIESDAMRQEHPLTRERFAQLLSSIQLPAESQAFKRSIDADQFQIASKLGRFAGWGLCRCNFG